MWWNLSIHSIFVLLLTVTSGQYTDPIYPVENVCLAILNRLSETAATFLDCACKRARPFKLCEGCIDHYVRLQDLVHLLDQSHSDSKQTITCKQFLESYDSIQLVARLINFVQSIWTSSVCDDCFFGYADVNGTVTFNLTDNIIEFSRRKQLFDLCIFNVTGRLIPIVPIDFNATLNTNVCTVCSSHYNSINDLFSKMSTNSPKGVCMDIVDTMNYTRLLWSRGYACQRHDPDFVAVIGISIFIPTIVLVFYVSALFKGERKQKKLSRQKRISPHTATAALVGTRYWLWSNPND